MVRTSKKVKYKKEQEELVNKLLEILPLKDNGFTLYEMDNNKERQEKILELKDDIKKYFVYRNIGVIKNKHNSKRIWLPLCRCVLRQYGYEFIVGSKNIKDTYGKNYKTQYYKIMCKKIE